MAVIFWVMFILLAIGNLHAQTCKVTDYLYLNDPGDNTQTNGFVHKLKLNPGQTATEINSTGTAPWIPVGGGLPFPHGLGQDLNGFLYIGQHEAGPIAKIKCDGSIVNPAFINDGGFNIVSKDGYLFVNTANDNGNRINRYALCDGSLQGYVTLNGPSSVSYTYGNGQLVDWGMAIASDGTIYASAGFNNLSTPKDTYLYRFLPTTADWTNHTTYNASYSPGVGVSLLPGSGTTGISTRYDVWGITPDNAGNVYLMVMDRESGQSAESWILKYDKNFNLIGSLSQVISSTGTSGIQGGRGLVYYAPWDKLIIAGGATGDCLALVDPAAMSYVGPLVPNVPGQNPKTLRVASEACPVAQTIAVDTTLCNVKVGDKIFLQNIIGKCNAPICAGGWTADPGNAGIIFAECDLSFTITDITAGCGTFVLKNTGGTCGDFTVTLKVNFANITAPVIAGDQTVCSQQTPAPFTISTAATGSNTIKYQWQKSTTSCTTGFADITGATNSTYAPGAVLQTTYYRLITSVSGGCASPFGSCSAVSNCVTVTYVNTTVNITATPGTCDQATNKYSVSGTINLTNALAGSATITDGTSTTTVTVASGDTSIPYTLAGLTSDGVVHTIQVDLLGCGSNTATYTAPVNCLCPTGNCYPTTVTKN